LVNEVPVEAIEAKKPVEVTAEDLADEEWGPVKEKKKDKKGKSKKGKQLQDEGEEEEEKGTLAIMPCMDLCSYITSSCRRCSPCRNGDLRRQGRGG
jgi:hypothetical protein